VLKGPISSDARASLLEGFTDNRHLSLEARLEMESGGVLGRDGAFAEHRPEAFKALEVVNW
jgi:hypothetical protein